MGEAGRSSWLRVAAATAVTAAVACAAAVWLGHAHAAGNTASDLDQLLTAVLKRAGFTGTHRVVAAERASAGPWTRGWPTSDGSSSSTPWSPCTTTTAARAATRRPRAFGDSQSIAIGIQNNEVVGRHRVGPRNQRRTPTVVNTAFYPNLMWNGRFSAPSGDPFDNSAGLRVSRCPKG